MTVVALGTAGLLVAASTAPALPAAQLRAIKLTSADGVDSGEPTIGLVMGGSGIPLPEDDFPNYVQDANNLYIDNSLHPNFPGTTYPAPLEDGLFTPEYPLLGLPFTMNYPTATTGPLAGFPDLSSSMGQDMLILENAIKSDQGAGDTSTVFGWSQSSSVSGLAMEQLDPSGAPMPHDGVQFALVGDPSNPDGGLLERFDGLTMPALGISFDGATPSDDFPTDIYTLEYDGFADFPKYPIDFISDFNALLGFVDVHGEYLSLTPQQVANAILLPGSAADGTSDSLTNYYMIPHAAPLVSLLSQENPQMGALLGPALALLIHLGYGPDNLGYSDTAANVPTPFAAGLPVSSATLMSELTTALQQGAASVNAAAGPGSGSSELTSLFDQLGVGGSGSESSAISALANELAGLAGAGSGAGGSGLGGVLSELASLAGTGSGSGGLLGDLLGALTAAGSSSGGSGLTDLFGALTGTGSGMGSTELGSLLGDLLGSAGTGSGSSGLAGLLGDLFSGQAATSTAPSSSAGSGLDSVLGGLTGTTTSSSNGSGLGGVLGELLHGLIGNATPGTDLDQTGLGSLLGDPGMPAPDFTSDTDNITMFIAGVADEMMNNLDLDDTLLTTLPTYDGALLADNPTDGSSLAAAADVGLLTLFGGIEFLLSESGASVLAGELEGEIPS
ncbi:MAG TPA: PE-PPE domain-containing protein [Mycobacterium sp.]|nr:PE-PPE domain-containing protein [Mycobacterium sp.]